jgi:hypothetical protein
MQLNATSLFGTQNPLDNVLASSGNSAASTDFQNALSSAVAATLKEFGIDPNAVTVSVAPAASATPSATPFSAAATDGTAMATPASATPATTSAPTAPSAPAPSFDDTYWASQPPAVQALRSMSDYDQRSQLASQLEAQGYNIDVPIMVWGWDPAKITAARQSYGYTWVPSAEQSPITIAPGISQPGDTPYNANNPPAGSIAV